MRIPARRTGGISGSPLEESTLQTYVVSAANIGGVAQVVLEITVVETPPSGLVYEVMEANYNVGESVPENTPDYDGGDIAVFTVVPSLPPGLEFVKYSAPPAPPPPHLPPFDTHTVCHAENFARAPVVFCRWPRSHPCLSLAGTRGASVARPLPCHRRRATMSQG